MSETPAQSEDRPDLLADCRLMLRFARESGIDLPPELIRDIAALDAILKQLELPPVSELPTSLLGDVAAPKSSDAAVESHPAAGTLGAPTPTDASESNALKPSGTELALKVHGALSKIVAPATALTLRATEPAPGKHGVFARMPKIVKWAAVAAMVSAVGFVWSTTVIAQKAADQRAADQKAVEEKKKAEAGVRVPGATPPPPAAKEGEGKP